MKPSGPEPQTASRIEAARDQIERVTSQQEELTVLYAISPLYRHEQGVDALEDPERVASKLAGEMIHLAQSLYSRTFDSVPREELTESERLVASLWEMLDLLPRRNRGLGQIGEDEVPPVLSDSQMEEIVRGLDRYPEALGPMLGPALRLARDPERPLLPDELDLFEISVREQIHDLDDYSACRDLRHYADSEPGLLREWLAEIIIHVAAEFRCPSYRSRRWYRDGLEVVEY